MWNPFLSTTIINGFLSVDTFFVLSGILVAYLFFKSKPSLRYMKNPMVWIMYYVHRYLRLTPPVMLFIWFFVVMLPFTNGTRSVSVEGFLDTTDQLVENCEKYWWRNMLYVNNFFDSTKECYGITWYLAVDTQLYVVAPILLIALFISPVAGLIIILLCIAGSVGYVYAITIQNDFPAVIIGALVVQTNNFFNMYYQLPWTRCPPYFIGIATGYFLAKGKKRKLNKGLVLSLWISAAAVALGSLYGPYRYIKGADKWSEAIRGTYNNLSRVGWALAVSWVITANHLGWGGVIAKFMDHPWWQPLGRLSYCGYIAHFFVIRYVFNLDDRPTHFISVYHTYVHRVVPVVAATYVLAVFWSLIFEVPVIRIEKVLTESLIPRKKNAELQAKAHKKNEGND